MKLTVKEIFRLAALVDAELTKAGAYDAEGNVVLPKDPQAYATFVLDIEAALKADGLIVPAKVDQIVQSLPAILPFVLSLFR